MESPDLSERVEEADYLVFESSSGVKRFWDRFGHIPEKTTCVCIGGVTMDALQKRYPWPALLAPEISTEGIVQAILNREAEILPH